MTKKRCCSIIARKILCFLLVLYCCVAFYIFTNFEISNSPPNLYPKDVCTSEECFRAARDLKSTMNTSEDICQNAYTYGCSNWAANYPGAKNVYNLIEQAFEKDHINFFRSDEAADEPKPVRQSRYMFHSCIDQDARNELGYKPIYEILLQLGLTEIPAFFKMSETSNDAKRTSSDWIEIDAMANKLLNLQLFIRCDVSLYYGLYCSTDNKLLHYDRATDFAETKYARINFMNFTISSFIREIYKVPVDFEENLIIAMDRIFKIETKLQMIKMSENIYCDHHIYVEPNNLLQTYIIKLIEGLKKTIPFDRVIRLCEDSEKYYDFVFRLLEEESEENLELWVWWKVIDYLLPQTTTEAMKYANDVFNESGVNLKMTSEELCSNITTEYMDFAVYYGLLNDLDANKKLEDMWNNMRESFAIMINSATWMADTEKIISIKRLTSINLTIGFKVTFKNILEKHYSSISIANNTTHLHNMVQAIQHERFPHSDQGEINKKLILDVNAYYWHTLLELYIPPGIIYYPFYYLGLPSMDYGAMGTVFGHELAHGFGTDEKFNDEKTQNEFTKRATCFEKQYNEFYLQEHSTYVYGIHTLEENIADNVGLKIAYEAYQLYRRKLNKIELKLPKGLEEFTPDQQFFLSYIFSFCANEIYDVRDTHAPWTLRALGSLRNFDAFAAAFNCPLGSNMNPKDKCEMW